ncbi:MAG TPA: hypothetical protein VHB21_09420, partial [Minicystis sp.]|nr:hypothetical protein [Minicystis sp.]
MARFTFAAAAAALLGCAGGAPPPRVPHPGEAALRVVNEVGDGFEIASLTLTVDGAAVPVVAVPPRRGAPPTTLVVPLPRGEHVIDAHAVVTETGTHDRVVVCTQQTVRAGATPGVVTVRVYSRPPRPVDRALARGAGAVGPDTNDERVALDVTLASAGVEAGPAVDACGTKAPMERAVCHATAQLDRASRDNDVVLTLCVRDRLAEMRRLVDLAANV